jgi:hypothetical protein
VPANPLTCHGPLRVSDDRTHLTHIDGTPFFYLADTAWNGALLSSDGDWETYLADRAGKGFTAIQFITHAPWSGALTDVDGRTAFTGDAKRPVDTAFFDRIARRIAQINAVGLLAVPVLAWAANFGPSRRLNLGHTVSADRLISLLRYQLDRFAEYHCLHLLAGDAVYDFWRARKWKRIARALGTRNLALGTCRSLLALHPAGQTWPYARFRHEPWLSLYAYQSGHSESPQTLRWLQAGPPANFWKSHPRPTINVEPCYEGLSPGRGQPPFDDGAVRRAIYWSLLNAPTAGVAYGAHGVWSWNTRTQVPLNHSYTGPAQPWHVALNFPASHQVRHLATLMQSIKWWILRPDPTLIAPQTPGPHYVAASRSDAGDLALLFLPTGGTIVLNTAILQAHLSATWFNPRTGERTVASAKDRAYIAPTTEDWLLLLA